MDEAYGVLGQELVPADVRLAVVSKVLGGEGIIELRDIPLFEHGVCDGGAPDGCLAGKLTHALEAEPIQPHRAQLLDHLPGCGVAPTLHLRGHVEQVGVGVVHPQAEHVHLALVDGSAQLDAGDHLNAELSTRRHRLRDARDGVVVRDGDRREPHILGKPDELTR